MELDKHKEMIARLVKRETEGALIEMMDRETYCFLENSPIIDKEIYVTNYKWCRSGENEENNIYPFKGWNLQVFFLRNYHMRQILSSKVLMMI